MEEAFADRVKLIANKHSRAGCGGVFSCNDSQERPKKKKERDLIPRSERCFSMLYFMAQNPINNLLTVTGGLALDRLAGDPPRIPHPVVGFGKSIAFLERVLNRKGFSPWLLRINGLVTVFLILAVAYILSYYTLRLLAPLPWLYWPVNLWLMGTTVAAKGLSQAGNTIYRLLNEGRLKEARIEVGKVVGRDTDQLGTEEITRATVETITENTVDGVISPLFYGLIGGLPLAMVYRAINTLDSMLGYKNERFLYFGWAAARVDDLANLIPARLTALLMALSAFLLGLNWRNGIRITLRDAGKHPSPNGGWPEAMVAGALGVRLGGCNYYQGVASFRNFLGDQARPLEAEDIRSALRILNTTVFLVLLFNIVLWGIIIIEEAY